MSLRTLSLSAMMISLCTIASAMEPSDQPQPTPITPPAAQKNVAFEAVKGAALGKGAVSIAGHGAIAVASAAAGLIGGPAAGYGAWTALEAFFAPSIEVYSYKAAGWAGIAAAMQAEEHNAKLQPRIENKENN
jgi:hypothetical protein